MSSEDNATSPPSPAVVEERSDASSKDLKKSLGDVRDETVSSSELSTGTDSFMKSHEATLLARLKALTVREEALNSCTITPKDVEFLETHFSLTKGLAERILRVAGGDLKAAAKQLIT